MILRIASSFSSWYFWMTRSQSSRISSSVCTTLSGGSPPSFLLRDMEPRVGESRIPRLAAALNCCRNQITTEVLRDRHNGDRLMLVQPVFNNSPYGEHGRVINGFFVQMFPDLIQIGQPFKQLGILNRRQVARQGLVKVVMGVNKARYHHTCRSAVDDPVGRLQQYCCRFRLCDFPGSGYHRPAVIPHQQIKICKSSFSVKWSSWFNLIQIGMDSFYYFFKTRLTGFTGFFYVHHFPEESDET